MKTESEPSAVCPLPPKSCVEVKSERTQGGPEQHGTVDKPALLSESPVQGNKLKTSSFWTLKANSLLPPPGGLERVKTELREEVSGHSSVSDVESDSDSPTEVRSSEIHSHYRLYFPIYIFNYSRFY